MFHGKPCCLLAGSEANGDFLSSPRILAVVLVTFLADKKQFREKGCILGLQFGEPQSSMEKAWVNEAAGHTVVLVVVNKHGKQARL